MSFIYEEDRESGIVFNPGDRTRLFIGREIHKGFDGQVIIEYNISGFVYLRIFELTDHRDKDSDKNFVVSVIDSEQDVEDYDFTNGSEWETAELHILKDAILEFGNMSKPLFAVHDSTA